MQMTNVLADWLEPVITPEVARGLLSLQPNPKIPKRGLELGAKANEGTLSPAERKEYEAYISANDLIAILLSQARQVLERKAHLSTMLYAVSFAIVRQDAASTVSSRRP